MPPISFLIIGRGEAAPADGRCQATSRCSPTPSGMAAPDSCFAIAIMVTYGFSAHYGEEAA